MAVAVLSESPWENLTDLVNYAKEHPYELKFGHAGLGSTSHVVGELLKKEAGIKIGQVPFMGDAESVAELLGGHVQLIITQASLLRGF